MSPIHASVALAAMQIVASAEGADRRTRLMERSLTLRAAMTAQGFDLIGISSAIMPVRIGLDGYSRRLTAAVMAEGGIVDLVEHLAVARNACRWRLQVMADDTADDIADFAESVRRARESSADPDWMPRPGRRAGAVSSCRR